jgi:tetratricopeptide (TPR) repeat protein
MRDSQKHITIGGILALICLTLQTPAFSAQTTYLEGIACKPGPTLSRVALQLSTTTPFKIDTSGQRVDILLQNSDLTESFIHLPENEDVIKTLIVNDRKNLVVSLLLRRLPENVSASFNATTAEITLDIRWGKLPAIRPGIALNLPGGPAIAENGALRLNSRKESAAYQGNWRDFFHDFHSPLRIEADLPISIPQLPRVTGAGESASLTEFRGRAEREDWTGVLGLWTALPSASKQSQPDAEQVFLAAKAAIMTGQPGLAEALLSGHPEPDRADALYPCWHLELAYGYAANRKYHLALALLDDRLGAFAEDQPLFAPVNLLRGEIYLNIGQAKPARERFSALQKHCPDFKSEQVAARLADVMFKDAPEAAYLAYAGLLEQGNQALWQPYSLDRIARLAADRKNYQLAKRAYRAMQDLLPASAEKDLARFGLLNCEYMLGEESTVLEEMERLEKSAGDAEAGLRCRMRLLDYWVPKANFEVAQEKIARYQSIIEQSTSFELREEAAFKMALAHIFHGETATGIQRLEENLAEYTSGKLKAESGKLLGDFLPDEIARRLKNGEFFKAIALLEQHRKILTPQSFSPALLNVIATAYQQLGMPDKACRVYLYLLDPSVESTSRATALYQLAATRFAIGDDQLALDYARRYQREFPQGDQFGEALRIEISAIRNTQGLNEAAALLRGKNLPPEPAIQLWAAELFWSADQLSETEKCLAELAAAGSLPPTGILLRAEVAFRQKSYPAALSGFQQLLDNPELREQAKYRIAAIKLETNFRADGCRLLKELASEAKDPLWKKLAAVTLREATGRM